jgi:hypothetical protein
MIMPDTVLTKFPPLQERKHPALAGLIGVLTGGIGLAVYFKSLRDLLPVELAGGLVMAGSLVAATNPMHVAEIVFPIVGGLYGFLRARGSNRRRATPPTTPAVSVGMAG